MEDQIRYICYLRKSSEDDETQVLSLGSQRSELEPLIENEKLHVIGELSESRSAKLGGQRSEFNQLVKKIEKGHANGILLWSVNRLSRNASDTGAVIDLMDRGFLDIIKTPTQSFRNTPNDKFLLGLFASQAKLENDLKAVDIRRGLKKKAALGWRPCNPLPGYKPGGSQKKGLKTIEPDPETFPIVRRFFRKLLKQEATIQQLYEEAIQKYQLKSSTKKNLITRSTFYRIFNNPFYYGEFEYPKGSGSWFKGKHKPMISRSEFYRLQKILERDTNPKPYSSKLSLPFRGLFRCGECGMSITGTVRHKVQKNGNQHTYKYYHCTKKSKLLRCTQGYVSEELIKRKVMQLLNQIWLPREYVDYLIQEAQNDFSELEKSSGSIDKAVKKKLDKLSSRKNKLIEMRADGEIDADIFSSKMSELRDTKAQLEEQRADNRTLLSDALTYFIDELDFATLAKNKFENGSNNEKRAVIKHLGLNLHIYNKKVVIEPKRALLALKNHQRIITSKINRSEPPKLLNGEGLRNIVTTSPILRRGWDKVRTPEDIFL